jgi:hypothetical protein
MIMNRQTTRDQALTSPRGFGRIGRADTLPCGPELVASEESFLQSIGLVAMRGRLSLVTANLLVKVEDEMCSI